MLSSKRLRLLLHQLGVFLRFGDERVGQEEFQETSQRAGGKMWCSWQQLLPE